METRRTGEWLEINVPDSWVDKSIETVLKEIWKVPKGILHQFRMDHAVKVNHERKPWNERLTKGDKVEVHLFLKEEFGVIPEYGEFQILYEDDHLLIANKPAGIDTHPNDKQQTGTLANFVAYHFLINGYECKVRHIHRLDKGTTGAIIFAKHPLASALLDRMLEQREIRRTYVALVQGIMKKKAGIIQTSIGRDRHHPTRRRVSKSGQPATTYFKVLQSYPKENRTLIMLQLKTGRTHQIRVHMSDLGYPLIGDTLYGGKEIPAKRSLLHAASISFIHPITSEHISCMAPFIDKQAVFPKMDLISISQIQLY